MSDSMEHYAFFQNRDCEFFPCHTGIEENDFNCLFCYCPLYALGKQCKGACHYSAEGIKDCSDCILPHKKENYAWILSRFQEVLMLVKKHDEANEHT